MRKVIDLLLKPEEAFNEQIFPQAAREAAGLIEFLFHRK